MANKELAERFSCLIAQAADQGNVEMPQALPAGIVSDDALFYKQLRRWRNNQMARIALDDISGISTLPNVLQAVTSVAEQSLEVAIQYMETVLQRQHGECLTDEGHPIKFVVLAMGKFGGRELNFSSDIDIICLYEGVGCCKQSGLTAEEYFTKLVKKVAHCLNHVTEDGFVFRVDLRLRPYGGAGPLVMHFDQAENYYETQGRDWERYAFIKARAVAGDIAAGQAFLSRLRPFIYRRYLDFTALQGLRDLKAKIEQQYALKRLDDNVKLGRGGIRELEFIAQSFQLVRGGQVPCLRTVSLYEAIDAAAELQLISRAAAERLIEAYEFLRVVENRLQQRRDQQVHHLPAAESEQHLLAEVLGFESWLAFLAVLDQHRQFVHQQFTELLHTETKPSENGVSKAVTQQYQEQEAVFLAGAAYASLSERAQGYTHQILMALKQLDAQQVSAGGRLSLLKFLETILGRSTYLALLAEQPAALSRLAFFVSHSSWMAQQVNQHPHLLDELLDERYLLDLPDKQQKKQELNALLETLDENNLELAMDSCRRFKHSLQFRIAAADVAGALPVMRVSDHLTEMAEVLLQAALDWVAKNLQLKTGRPYLLRGGQKQAAQLMVVGYGKLGGVELGYGSDLDIVLLHDGDGKALGTDGEKCLDNAVYFQRLGQRLIHFLSANTPAGRLYEIDTRLRPSGASGLLVCSMQAYEKYQRNDAWTWEHQALVRARAVAGPRGLAKQFAAIRSTVLQLSRTDSELKQAIIEMREKMRSHLDDSSDGHFNPKHGRGGLVDIEFLCQYLTLAKSPQSQSVTDNVRQIKAFLDAGLLTESQANQLTNAYIGIRGYVHHQKLGMEVAFTKELQHHAQRVVAIWQDLLE